MNSSFLSPVHELANDLPRLLRWAGFALLGLFAISVLNSLVPLALVSPAWQLQQIQVLLQQGPTALIGVCLVGVSRYLASGSRSRMQTAPEGRRQLALVVAAGYSLLIPLQIFATSSQWQQATNREATAREQLRSRLETLYRQMGSAGSDAQLQQQLRQLPVTAAPSLERLGADPQARRQAAQGLVSRISDAVALEFRRREERRGLQVLRSSLRNSLAALLLAVAWLMVGVPRLALPRGGWRALLPRRSRRSRRHHLEEMFDPALVPVDTEEAATSSPLR